jgi:hypothetical protein
MVVYGASVPFVHVVKNMSYEGRSKRLSMCI